MAEDKRQVNVLWTSGEKETAMHMVLLYTYNALRKEWMDEVNLLIWGAASKLVAEDEEVREHVIRARDEGVKLIACKRCALDLGVAEELEALGVEVRYTGDLLTEWLLSDVKMLTI